MKYVKWTAVFAVLALLGGAGLNQEVGNDKTDEKKPDAKKADDKKADEKKPEKPATHKVAKKPFKLELSVSGILSAADAVEIGFRPQPMLQPAEGQNPLTIKQVAAHGARVKKGETLIGFDTTKLNEVIDNAEVEQKVQLASIKVAEEELPLAERSAPLELAAAQTAKKRADEDLKYFLDVAKEQTVKDANLMVKFTKFMLEFTEDENTQLKKMYKANDLTEETERMILKRQQHYVEQMKAYYDSTVMARDYLLKFTLPNRERAFKDEEARAVLALDRVRKTLAPGLVQKEIALAKMRHDFDKGATRLAKLLKDRAAMTIAAPLDGVVYHGRFQQGSWTAPEGESKLLPGNTVQPDKVLLTVVKPGPLEVHLSVDEKEVHLLRPDLKGTLKLPARPDRKLPVRVAWVSVAPSAPGKFASLVRLDAGPGNADLVPGLACSIKFVPYAKKDAITVPTKCLDEDGDEDVVYVLSRDGKHEMRPVTLGKSDAEQTEILAGLREGDEVLLERPGLKSAAKEKDKAATP